MGRPPGTTVFVGNISYDTNEDQLKDVFSQVGNVISFRLMYDPETGRPKGYGFCEYEDKETAMSARRNLNGTPLNGRPLRVDLTDSDKQNAALNGLTLTNNNNTNLKTTNINNKGTNVSNVNPNHPNQRSIQQQQQPSLPPALATANPSMTMLSLPEIHQTMLHLKKAVVQNPNEMRELLTTNPRLAHAILQGQLMLGMVPRMAQPGIPQPPQQRPKHVPSVPGPPIGVNSQPTAAAATAAAVAALNVSQKQSQPSQPPPPPPQMQPPPRAHPPIPPGPHPGMEPIPPQMMQNGPPPPAMMPNMMQQQQARMGSAPAPQQPLMEDQAEVLNRVMNMTQQEIDELPLEARNYVLQLKDVVQGVGGLPPNMNPSMPPGPTVGPGPVPPPPGPPMNPGMPPPQQPYR